jgi:biopolymer transport protein ExbD
MRALFASFLIACAKPDAGKQQVVIAPPPDVVAPPASFLPPRPANEVRIALSASGAAPTDDELTRLTKDAVTANPDVVFVLDADDQTPYAQVIHAMDVLKRAGATRISLATPSASTPPASAAATGSIVVIALRADGTATMNGKPATNDAALPALAQQAHADRVRIDADGSVPHGRVIHLLDGLKRAGVTKIAFGVTAGP